MEQSLKVTSGNQRHFCKIAKGSSDKKTNLIIKQIKSIAELMSNKQKDIVLLALNRSWKPPTSSNVFDVELNDAEKHVKRWRDLSYQFCDVFFKSISWFGALLLLDFARDVTGYGLFWVFEIVGVVSFLIFLALRTTIFVFYIVKRSGMQKKLLKAVTLSVIISAPLTIEFRYTPQVIPIMMRKLAHAQHCSKYFDEPLNRPIDCSSTRKHSRLRLFF